MKAAVFFAILFFGGCAIATGPTIESPVKVPAEASSTPPTAAGEIMESTPHVSPYLRVEVVDVELRFLNTNPVEVELVIHGTLPDQCTYMFYSVESRTPQNVRVSLDAIHPPESDCQQTAQQIEYILPLGKDLPETERGFAPGEYQLTVNDYQTNFSIQ